MVTHLCRVTLTISAAPDIILSHLRHALDGKLYKYNWQFEQIQFVIGTNMFARWLAQDHTNHHQFGRHHQAHGTPPYQHTQDDRHRIV